MIIKSNFGILKNRWIILKNLNLDVNHAAFVIIACCVLYNFCHMNYDICCIGVVEMQDLHPNLNVPKKALCVNFHTQLHAKDIYYGAIK